MAERADSKVVVIEACTVGKLSKLRKVCLAGGLALLLGTAYSEDTTGQAAQALDARTLSIQEKVDELFESGKFERAYFIYRNELAPVGDKYAQYMVGYMYLMGLGVEEDVIHASAWYRLAAERGYPEFVAVRNQVMESLEDTEITRSDIVFIELRKQYSDLSLMLTLLRKDLEDKSGRVTGSRLSGRSGAVTIVNPNSGVGMSGDSYYRKRKAQMQARLDYITDRLEMARITDDVDEALLDDLQVRVDEYVQSIDDR